MKFIEYIELLALASLCICNRKCWKGILCNPKQTDCKSLFSDQKSSIPDFIFSQESSLTGPEVKHHSTLIHSEVCPAKDWLAAIELLTSCVAQDEPKKEKTSRCQYHRDFHMPTVPGLVVILFIYSAGLWVLLAGNPRPGKDFKFHMLWCTSKYSAGKGTSSLTIWCKQISSIII